jgi:putative tricarboxylic transport membrane protein
MRWTLVLIALLLASAACARSEQSGSYPRTAIEFIVPFQPGGGSDVLARNIHAIVTRERMMPVPINVVNKPGGAGAVGLANVAARRGDPHTLMTLIDTVIAVPLQPDYKGPTWRDLTVVAILALDDMLVVVPAASPFETIEELIAHAKAHPGKLKLATNAAGGEDHIYGGLIEAAAGVKFTYVHTRGGAEAMQHIVGGHVDVVVPNPSETLSQLEGRLVRALAVGAPERLPILPDVPTLKERGVDVEYRMFRGIGLPGEVPAEAVTYWQTLLDKVVASPAWKRDYIDKLAVTPHVKKGDEAVQFLAGMEQLYRKTLRQLGVISS